MDQVTDLELGLAEQFGVRLGEEQSSELHQERTIGLLHLVGQGLDMSFLFGPQRGRGHSGVSCL